MQWFLVAVVLTTLGFMYPGSSSSSAWLDSSLSVPVTESVPAPDSAVQQTTLVQPTNPGSLRHGIDCKPCFRFHRGKCIPSVSQCNFCHVYNGDTPHQLFNGKSQRYRSAQSRKQRFEQATVIPQWQRQFDPFIGPLLKRPSSIVSTFRVCLLKRQPTFTYEEAISWLKRALAHILYSGQVNHKYRPDKVSHSKPLLHRLEKDEVGINDLHALCQWYSHSFSVLLRQLKNQYSGPKVQQKVEPILKACSDYFRSGFQLLTLQLETYIIACRSGKRPPIPDYTIPVAQLSPVPTQDDNLAIQAIQKAFNNRWMDYFNDNESKARDVGVNTDLPSTKEVGVNTDSLFL